MHARRRPFCRRPGTVLGPCAAGQGTLARYSSETVPSLAAGHGLAAASAPAPPRLPQDAAPDVRPRGRQEPSTGGLG